MMGFISLRNLHFSYSGRNLADEWSLRIPSFCLKPQSFVLLTGDNMSGKTTFLRILAGKQNLSSYHRHRFPASPKENHDVVGTRATLLSNADQMFPELSIWDNVRVTLPRLSQKSEYAVREKCMEFLSKSDIFFDRSVDDLLGELSSGGRAIVKLCRAVASSRHILLVDEMTSYLDEQRAFFFLDYLIGRSLDGDAVVLVSHSDRDREYVKQKLDSSPYVAEFHIRRSKNVSELEVLNG